MNRVIKIRKIEGITYISALEAVLTYITIYEFANTTYGVKIYLNEGCFYPVYVKCKTTPTSHIFDVWLTV